MYRAYWEMQSRPFVNGIAGDFYVPFESVGVASTKVQYVLTAELGAVALLGAAGCGKTLLMQRIFADLQGAGWATAYMCNVTVSAPEFLAALSSALGAPPVNEPLSPYNYLQKCLAAHSEVGREVCVIVDDVQAIRDELILENLRQILQTTHNGRRVLNLVLVGQEAAEEKLRRASGLQTHLAMRVMLTAMTEDETQKYILYRLKVAGCKRGIFTRHAAEQIHRLTGGVPRDVNRLGELCLVTGFGLEVNKIGPDIVETAAQDLALDVVVFPRSEMPRITPRKPATTSSSLAAAASPVVVAPAQVPTPATPPPEKTSAVVPVAKSGAPSAIPATSDPDDILAQF